MAGAQLVVLVVDDDRQEGDAVAAEIAGFYDGLIGTMVCEGGSEALALVHQLRDQGTLIPLIVSDHLMPDMTGLQLAEILKTDALWRDSRFLILSGHIQAEEISQGLTSEWIDGFLTKPFASQSLRQEVKRLVSQYLIKMRPDLIEANPKLVSHEAYLKALRETERQHKALHQEIARLRKEALFERSIADDEVYARLSRRITAWAQGHGDKSMIRTYAPGEVILREGENNDLLLFVSEGQVTQYKEGSLGPVMIGQEGVGHLMGLLSFLTGEPSFSTVTAERATKLVRIDRKALEELFATDLDFMALFVSALLRMLKSRVTSVSETKVELHDALESLKTAQVQLVESEKMATLGLMTAGVAHELNNPAAALSRAADHVQSIVEDLIALWTSGPEDLSTLRAWTKEGGRVMAQALTAHPYSTATLRSKVQEWSRTYDRPTAQSLAELELGVGPSVSELVAQVPKGSRPRAILFWHQFFQLGQFLAHIRTSSSRIAHLVKGMKNYAKADAKEWTSVDVSEGLEDTAIVLMHRLKAYQFEKEYAPVGRVHAVPSQLNQVWTNLLTNACEATPPGARISVRVDPWEARNQSYVRVQIADEGCGIPPELQEKIFEPRFTTKGGDRQTYGLGLGLAISKKIVSDHRGEIFCHSTVGKGTTFTVILPLEHETPPPSSEDRA